MIRIICMCCALLFLGLILAIGFDLYTEAADVFYDGYLTDKPSDLGTKGGIAPIILNTFIIVGLAIAIAFPFSLAAAATYTMVLKSQPTTLQRLFIFLIDLGIGIPRIVWGLAGAAIFSGLFGLGFSIISGVLTLALLLSPILTFGFIAGIESLEKQLKIQCQVLGLTDLVTFWMQLIPSAKSALLTTTLIAVGRGFGDAAALLFTSGIASRIPSSILDPAATLSVWVFQLTTAIPGGEKRAFAAAFILFTITLIIQGCLSISNKKRFSL
ncbi:ABC transporter permease subunit [Aliikangiella coralliicola]|uniref:ABC transporter permease subunit n=1 Tax=Aliikangiella coralliicola TaxID=2592383 RepID=A0A545UFU4_9GAMM|nr:ABC transporter permease subunit [Aliikangiella coralliicola]TQV88339.1 ABC transporter permease subunit [Aliikangiella coralliicola]